jgi:hypothetical protein
LIGSGAIKKAGFVPAFFICQRFPALPFLPTLLRKPDKSG